MADEDDDDPVVDSKDHQGLVRRIEKLVRQKSQLEADLKASTAKVGELEKAAAESTKAAKDAAKVVAERDALAAEKAGWGEERAILGAGVTDAEGIDFVRLAYSRIPEADRPKGGPAEWLQDREKLPKGVQAYLPEAKDPAKPAPGAKPPAPNGGVKPTPQINGTPDMVGLSNQDFAASREAIWSQLGFTPPTLPKSGG